MLLRLLHQTILIIPIMRFIIIHHLMPDHLPRRLVSRFTVIIERGLLWRIDQALPVLLSSISLHLKVIIDPTLQFQDLKFHRRNQNERKARVRLCLLSVIENGMMNLGRQKVHEARRSDHDLKMMPG
jgi:hypothetical protein